MSLGSKVFFVCLLVVDRLLGTNLVERELARRRAKITAYRARLTKIEEQLGRLESTLGTINLRLCLLYLWKRNLMSPHGWLHFDPADPQEDKGLDLLINHMVKPHLAAIAEEELTKGHYIYHIEPDWGAIRNLLTNQQVKLGSELAGWLSNQ